MKKMSGLTGWFGGKNNMSEWIYSFIPVDQIDTYCEPFSGSFPIYFNEDFSKVKNIIFNDANKFQANFMQCAKDYDTLLNEIKKSFEEGFLYCDKTDIADIKKHYRDLYTNTKDPKKCDFYDNLDFNIPDFKRAVIYSFMITSAFNACFARGAGFSGFSSSGKLKIQTLMNKLANEDYKNKLDNLTHVYCKDFEELIREVDSDKTYLYLDPPYKKTDYTKGTHNTDYGSHDTFGEFGHERLANLLKECKSKWSLSYYYFPELEDWFPKDKYRWEQKEFFRSSSSFSDNKNTKGFELLIMNY